MCQYTDRKPFNWHIVELVYWHIIKKQPAYKPGSVLMTIYLGRLSPDGSCDYMKLSGPLLNAPLSILHRTGFTGFPSYLGNR